MGLNVTHGGQKRSFGFLPPHSMVVIFALCIGVFSPRINAQQIHEVEVKGYITAVQSPSEFDVNREHVTLRPETRFEVIGVANDGSEKALRDAIGVGAYVEVMGVRDKSAGTIAANTVLFRDDWDKKLSGVGLIDKVISGGPEPVYRADGYLIRIASSAEVKFQGDLRTLADVHPGTWMAYDGRRDKTGVVAAGKVAFVVGRLPKKMPGQQAIGQDKAPSRDSIIDAEGHFESARTKVRMSAAGGWCGWHRVPADPALQERVWRVGMRLVPGYQRELPERDASKIHFRFYAIDEQKIRSDIVCSEGLILIPREVVARLKNDDQLAALLADGVAFSLQLRSARLHAEVYEVAGAELAGEIAGFFVPGVYLASEFGAGIAESEIELQMERQRGRVALALMADAGYDPWQAPEAWRLLAPKKLPKNLDSLKYPNRSGYQLGILNLQYGGERVRKGVNP